MAIERDTGMEPVPILLLPEQQVVFKDTEFQGKSTGGARIRPTRKYYLGDNLEHHSLGRRQIHNWDTEPEMKQGRSEFLVNKPKGNDLTEP